MSKPKKYKLGLIVGKFYPLHKGHQYLIETGIKQTEKLVVAVCELSEHEISGWQRAEWIKELYPQVEVQVRNYDGVDPINSLLWASLAIDWVGQKPDVVFTSEEYGEAWAKAIGCAHELVDMKRVKIPISGTQVRENPKAAWEFLSKPVRDFYSHSLKNK